MEVLGRPLAGMGAVRAHAVSVLPVDIAFSLLQTPYGYCLVPPPDSAPSSSSLTPPPHQFLGHLPLQRCRRRVEGIKQELQAGGGGAQGGSRIGWRGGEQNLAEGGVGGELPCLVRVDTGRVRGSWIHTLGRGVGVWGCGGVGVRGWSEGGEGVRW